MTVPEDPTAHPWLASTNVMENKLTAPEDVGVHVAPPSVVWMKPADISTAQPLFASAKATEFMYFGGGAVLVHEV
jgi:hypothetical protein